MFDLSKFKVVYADKVLRAVALFGYEFKEDKNPESTICHSFKVLSVLVVDNNDNLKIIEDEAWRYQFIPVISERSENNAN